MTHVRSSYLSSIQGSRIGGSYDMEPQVVTKRAPHTFPAPVTSKENILRVAAARPTLWSSCCTPNTSLLYASCVEMWGLPSWKCQLLMTRGIEEAILMNWKSVVYPSQCMRSRSGKPSAYTVTPSFMVGLMLDIVIFYWRYVSRMLKLHSGVCHKLSAERTLIRWSSGMRLLIIWFARCSRSEWKKGASFFRSSLAITQWSFIPEVVRRLQEISSSCAVRTIKTQKTCVPSVASKWARTDRITSYFVRCALDMKMILADRLRSPRKRKGPSMWAWSPKHKLSQV
jgi:hypothetical protein